MDVLRSPAPVARPSYPLDKLLQRPALLDEKALKEFCEELTRARKIVFVLGDGCSEAIGSILDAARLLEALLVTTPHGKGLVNPYHPLFRGVLGFAGHASAREALLDPAVDLIVAIGTSLSEWASDGWDPRLLMNQRLIHVEACETLLIRSPMARLHVRGRFISIFERVLRYLEPLASRGKVLTGKAGGVLPGKEAIPWDSGLQEERQRHFTLDEEAKYHSDAVPIKPQRLMQELARMFPPNTRYLADTGSSFSWAIHYLHPFDRRLGERRSLLRRSPGRRSGLGGIFRACLEFAPMGWAIGSAIGTAFACPGDPVVCITGDGSLLMNGQEITVARQHQLPVIFVVLNDAALGMVKHGQRLTGAESTSWELPLVDFAAFAEALGVVGHVIRAPADLLALDARVMCRRRGPTLLDVRIDPEEIPPMGTRVRGLAKQR